MAKSDADDYVIRKGICKGKESALVQLMDLYIPYVQKIIFAIGGRFLSQQDAEELISDVFYAVWEHRKQLRIDEDIKPYLAQIARNKTKNKLRQLAKMQEITIESIDEIEGEVLFTDFVLAKGQVDQIQLMVNGFPYPEKDILYGYYFYGWKLAEIAAKLELPLSTVKTKLYRAREKLKQALLAGGIV